MDITKLVALSVVGAFLALLLKPYHGAFSAAVSVLTAVLIFLCIVPYMRQVLTYAQQLYTAAGGKHVYLDTVLKISGIACITWLGSDVLKEIGAGAASSAITLAGKVVCMSLCLPLLGNLFEMILKILP